MKKALPTYLSLATFLIMGYSYGQIGEERLILDKQREPEVNKIDKKKTSVERIKNYPPEEKNAVPIEYQIENVPAISDFKTSLIQGRDITPTIKQDYKNNYFRIGYGNYARILADGNLSAALDEKTDVGLDMHFLSTDGLKKLYPWNSSASDAKIGGYLNSYAEKGKFNLSADYGFKDYNYYGIYAMQPDSGIDLTQKTNVIGVRGHYDFYSNEILNDARLETGFLSDHFDAKESHISAGINLSKHGVALGGEEFLLNADLGLGVESLSNEFLLASRSENQLVNLAITPSITLARGESYLRLGAGFNFLSSQYSTVDTPGSTNDKTYWFPQGELLIAAAPEFKFFAGVRGGVHMHSYADMLEENPFLLSDQQTKSTIEKYHVYFGLKGDLLENLKYEFKGGFGKLLDAQYFRANSLLDNNYTLNRSAYNFANTFSAAYSDADLSEVTLQVQYFPLANLALDALVEYQKYKLPDGMQIYYKPEVVSSLGGRYTLLDNKLDLGARILLSSARYTNAFTIGSEPVDPMQEAMRYTWTQVENEKLEGFVDMNVSAEYRIHKNFSIFALGNNLLNNNYQQFKGYKVLGAQVMGGVKIIF